MSSTLDHRRRTVFVRSGPLQATPGFFVGKSAVIVERVYGKCSPPTSRRWEQRLSSEFFLQTPRLTQSIAVQSLLPLTQGQWRACLFAIRLGGSFSVVASTDARSAESLKLESHYYTFFKLPTFSRRKILHGATPLGFCFVAYRRNPGRLAWVFGHKRNPASLPSLARRANVSECFFCDEKSLQGHALRDAAS